MIIDKIDIKELKRLYNKGYTYREMGLLLGTSTPTIYKISMQLVERGELEPRPRNGGRKTTRELAQQAYLDGETDKKRLAEFFGVKPYTMSSYLSSLKRGHNKDKGVAIAQEIAYKNRTLSDIAREFGVSRQRVFYISKKLNEYLN